MCGGLSASMPINAYPRKFEPGAEQTAALNSVLPKKIAEWHNETTNRKYLKRSDEGEYIDMCRHVREEKARWKMKEYATSLAAKNTAVGRRNNKRPFDAL